MRDLFKDQGMDFALLEKKLEQLQKLQSKISPEEYAKREAALLDQLQPIETGTFIFTMLLHVVFKLNTRNFVQY